MKTSTQARSTPPQSAKERPQTRSLILEAALKLASRDGIEGLTIGELAKAVGMSKSGLFAHFGGREQLQLAVLETAANRFVDSVLRPAFKAPRGEARLQAILDNWLRHLNDRKAPPGSSVLIAAASEFDDRPGAIRDFLKTAERELVDSIEKAARMAVDEGQFSKDVDVEQFAWSMYAYVIGYLHFKRMLEDPKAETRLRRSFDDLIANSRANIQKTKMKTKKRR